MWQIVTLVFKVDFRPLLHEIDDSLVFNGSLKYREGKFVVSQSSALVDDAVKRKNAFKRPWKI